MGKIVQAQMFGTSRTDAIVKEWLDAKGIDPRDVQAYRISRSGDGASIPTIELTMYYDDSIQAGVSDNGVPS